MKPDFSHVTNLAEAQALAAKGELVKVLIFPDEFGGQDRPDNTTYIPPEAAQAKQLITDTLVRYFREGLINKLSIQPSYKNGSFVPERIAMQASHRTKQGSFEPAVEIW